MFIICYIPRLLCIISLLWFNVTFLLFPLHFLWCVISHCSMLCSLIFSLAFFNCPNYPFAFIEFIPSVPLFICCTLHLHGTNRLRCPPLPLGRFTVTICVFSPKVLWYSNFVSTAQVRFSCAVICPCSLSPLFLFSHLSFYPNAFLNLSTHLLLNCHCCTQICNPNLCSSQYTYRLSFIVVILLYHC